MKKVIYGFLLIAVFGLTACGNDKKEATASSKVEQLESRVKDLESSSSSEAEQSGRTEDEILSEVKSETNKKIVTAFLDNNLVMYNKGTEAVYETENNDNGEISDFSPTYTMYFTEQNDNPTLYFTVSVFESLENLNEAYDVKANESGEYFLSKNDNILALMIGEAVPKSAESENLFNKYKEVFENIQ